MCGSLDKRGKEARDLFWKLMRNEISREQFDSRITNMTQEQIQEDAIQMALFQDYKNKYGSRGGGL
jgi:hypothetical protein